MLLPEHVNPSVPEQFAVGGTRRRMQQHLVPPRSGGIDVPGPSAPRCSRSRGSPDGPSSSRSPHAEAGARTRQACSRTSGRTADCRWAGTGNRRRCPGAQPLAVGGNEFEAAILAAVGPVKARFKGKVQIQDSDPPQSYTLKIGDRRPGCPAGTARIRGVATRRVVRNCCMKSIGYGPAHPFRTPAPLQRFSRSGGRRMIGASCVG
jgi:hypothetical protein